MAKVDDRLFAPFPIEMDEHPKIIGLTDASFRALIEGIFYSRRMLSDGFLDERVVLRRWGQKCADELSSNDVEKPSWVRVDGGWKVHDFEKHHPLRAEIEEKRLVTSAKRRQAGSKGLANRWQKDGKPIANDSSETETETETSPSTKEREPAKRGTRLSEQWMPSAESVAVIKTSAPNVDARAEHATFIDYWIAQPGQKGVKTNWDSTWRNWMRRKQADTVGAQKPRQTAAQRNLSTVAHFEQQQRAVES